MMKKLERQISVEKRIDVLRLEHKKLKDDHRSALYRNLENVMVFAVEVRKDAKLAAEIWKVTKRKNNDIVHAIVSSVIGGSSESAKKRSWKYARVLTYLVDVQSVPVDGIAKSIKSMGLEKLAREAAKNSSRQSNKAKISGGRSRRSISAPSEVTSSDVESISNPEMSQPISIHLTSRYRPQLNRLQEGDRIKIIAVRTAENDEGPLLKVTKVARLKNTNWV